MEKKQCLMFLKRKRLWLNYICLIYLIKEKNIKRNGINKWNNKKNYCG